jgi:hypothetical protein
MEIRYVRDVERAHGLPTGVRQFSPRRDGYQLHDIGYAEQRVLVELDGRLGHEGSDARVRDGIRDRRGATSGWLTMRTFWRDVAGYPCDLAIDTGDPRQPRLVESGTPVPSQDLLRPRWSSAGRQPGVVTPNGLPTAAWRGN